VQTIQKPMSETNSHVWAFDLGKGSIGEAVRQGNKFLHKASLLIPANFAENKKGAAKAPCGSHRSRLATQAASALPNHS
jgi:hypothetical protein